MSMSLTKPEKAFFDERFKNLHERIKDVKTDVNDLATAMLRVNEIDKELAKRPTITQMFAACGFFLVLGASIATAVFFGT